MDVNNFLQRGAYDLLNRLAASAIMIAISVVIIALYYTVITGLSVLLAIVILALTIYVFLTNYIKERPPIRDLLNDEYMLDYTDHRVATQNGECATLAIATSRISGKIRAIKIFFASMNSAKIAGSRLCQMKSWDRTRVVRFFTVDDLPYDPMRNVLYKMLVIPISFFVFILRVVGEKNDRRLLTWSRIAKAEKVVYLTLKFMDGGCMENYLTELRHRSLTDKIHYANQLTLCLDYLHKRVKKVHLNLKLSNILHEKGVPILSDPGIADTHQDHPQLFHSPEQINELAVDYKSDIYSMGLIFACLFTSHDEFNKDAFVKEIKEKKEIIREYNMIPSVSRLIVNMLNDYPYERYDASEIYEELSRILNDQR